MHGLLGDVDGVVSEPFEVEGHPERSAELAGAVVAADSLRQLTEAGVLDEAEEVIDPVVSLSDIPGQDHVALKERGQACPQLRLDRARHGDQVVTDVAPHHDRASRATAG